MEGRNIRIGTEWGLVSRGLNMDISCVSIAAEKVAEVLALPEPDRAFLARELIASLDESIDADSEKEWAEVIGRRTREIDEGKVTCRPVNEVIEGVREKLNARRQPS